MKNKTSADKVQELHDIAVEKLIGFLNGGELDDLRIKASMTAFNGAAREMATWRAQEAVQLAVIKGITEDKTELKKYVKATMPEFYPDLD